MADWVVAQAPCRYRLVTSHPYSIRSDQGCVRAFDAAKALVSSPLYDDPTLKNDDLVTVPNRAQAMGDDKARAAPSPQVIVDYLFGVGIQSAGSFVENQDARITH